MERFDLSILGCGSASPTSRHFPSSQVVNHNERFFMIDCDEGAQMQFRAMKLKFPRLNHIFLSHLHGDHCFGLIGLISTLGLVGRTSDLFVYAHPDAQRIFSPAIDYFCKDLPFEVKFVAIQPQTSELLYEDKSLRIVSLPLKHRIPTAGFLVEEKAKLHHIVPEMIEHYHIPRSLLMSIKQGEDFITSEGDVIPNRRLTTPSAPPRRYAYCSDTAYCEKLLPLIKGVDVLYHEATFASDNLARAKETCHSTALQAARMAQQAGVGRLILGHFSARYHDEEVLLREARTLFVNTVLATDRMRMEIERPKP